MANDDYFDDEEFRELLDDYENAVASGAPIFMDAEDLADIAEYYEMNERYDDARKAIDTAYQLNPQDTGVLNFKINQALDDDDVAAAEGYLEQMIERESPEYVYCKAKILVAKGQEEEADTYLRKKLRTVPDDEYQDYVLDAANIFSDYGADQKAMEWMMRAKQENTEDFKELMARTLFGLGKYKDSERIFQQLIDANPFEKRYWNALASTQFMSQDYGAAVTSSEYAIAIDPKDPESIIAKANALVRLDNNEEALKYYQRYTEIAPDDEFGLLNQGVCLINLGQYDEAIDILKKAMHVSPPDSVYLPDIWQELAFAYSSAGLPETALEYIEKTEGKESDHADACVVRGHILLSCNRLREAEEAFKEAILSSDSSPRILLRIVVSLYDNKYVEAAYHMFKNLLDGNPEEWNEGWSYMALCCYDLHRDDECLHYLDIACRRNPQEARLVLSHLFPPGMEPEDYHEYMKKELKKS